MAYNVIQSVIHNAIFDTNGKNIVISSHINQVAHGFAINNVITHNGTEYVKASIDSSESIVVFGVVAKILSVDSFQIIKVGEIINDDLESLLDTVDGDNMLYLGIDGELVNKSNLSIVDFDKIPILKKIESSKAEILLSTQYLGFKNDMFVNVLHYGEFTAEGSWKVELDNSFLKYYRYEGGTWILKNTFGASIITDEFVFEDSAGHLSFEKKSEDRRISMIKPSVDGYGAVLGNPDGRIALVSNGEFSAIYPKSNISEWSVDNLGNGTYSPLSNEYEENNLITVSEVIYQIKIYVSTPTYKFRFALLKEDDSILVQNISDSEYVLEQNIQELVVGENTIKLKFPTVFTKGLPIKVKLITPTPTSVELGNDGKSANTIYRSLSSISTINYSKKWIPNTYYEMDEVINIEVFDVDYDNSKIGRYSAKENHTSSPSFVSDLLGNKWVKINEIGDGKYHGVFNNLSELQLEYPIAKDGDTATVISPTHNFYYWNSIAEDWEDTGLCNVQESRLVTQNSGVDDLIIKNGENIIVDDLDGQLCFTITSNTKIFSIRDRDKSLSSTDNVQITLNYNDILYLNRENDYVIVNKTNDNVWSYYNYRDGKGRVI